MLTDDQFDKGMAILGAAFPESQLSGASYEVYRDRLKRLSPSEWEAAVTYCVDHLKFFPKIAELNQAVKQLRPNAAEVWSRLIEAAESGEKPPMTKAEEEALQAVGGWNEFETTSYADLRFRFKVFAEALERAWAVGESQGRMIEGGKKGRNLLE